MNRDDAGFLLVWLIFEERRAQGNISMYKIRLSSG